MQKRHTSFASVFVYPLADDSIEIIVDPSELVGTLLEQAELEDKGVNKTESNCCLTETRTNRDYNRKF